MPALPVRDDFNGVNRADPFAVGADLAIFRVGAVRFTFDLFPADNIYKTTIDTLPAADTQIRINLDNMHTSPDSFAIIDIFIIIEKKIGQRRDKDEGADHIPDKHESEENAHIGLKLYRRKRPGHDAGCERNTN